MRQTAAVVILLSLVATIGYSTQAAEPDPTEESSQVWAESHRLKKLRLDIESKKNALVKPGPRETQILLPSENVVYIFTEPSNLAHPAYILVKESESDVINYSGSFGSESKAFHTWHMKISENMGVIMRAIEQGSWNGT